MTNANPFPKNVGRPFVQNITHLPAAAWDCNLTLENTSVFRYDRRMLFRPKTGDKGKSGRTFARWVSTPENRSARIAVDRVAEATCALPAGRTDNPLLLHGPAGIGKTHLVSALVTEVIRRRPDLVVSMIS